MITIARIAKTSILIFILSLQACSFGKQDGYLKDIAIQNVLDKAIDSLLVEVPIQDYVRVLFTESEGKTYVFVTGLLSPYNFKTKYYFEKGGKKILIGYSNLSLEERFANLTYKKPEKVFEHLDEVADIFDGNSVTYEVENNNTIKRINPSDEIWELQFHNVEPLPEPPLEE
ncbi:hypothetical protein Lbys_3291 [Leadbetterella byssophila DSM 17132]|uniref:Lipoprotein n=1 Tax=Leadbetterella byssophila (strain DSM 17132 / JCM 16389 / KACC 11308 / NBRC 106382 / 4M15) TaxID=649349 RepID=E4RWK8_LEAB4|nr:hypothetical protein [Leadbetterella byssophila]ADQ18948.1 hypothetical protein Lbys_3291 [Leadbetterella byssophila DSM 17132]